MMTEHPEFSFDESDESETDLSYLDFDSTELRAHTRALYEQWRVVYRLIYASIFGDQPNDKQADNATEQSSGDAELSDEETLHEHMIGFLLSDSQIVAVKLHSASAFFNQRVLLLGHAAIIRQHAQQVWVGLHSIADAIDEHVLATPVEFLDVIRGELGVFQRLFREWAARFPPTGPADEWGLFK